MWIVAVVLCVVAVVMGALAVLFAGDPEGRGLGIALRIGLGAAALLAFDAVLVLALLVRRFLVAVVLVLAAGGVARAADWQGMEQAADLAAAETNLSLCHREAEVTGENARALCARRHAEMDRLRADLDADRERAKEIERPKP